MSVLRTTEVKVVVRQLSASNEKSPPKWRALSPSICSHCRLHIGYATLCCCSVNAVTVPDYQASHKH